MSDERLDIKSRYTRGTTMRYTPSTVPLLLATAFLALAGTAATVGPVAGQLLTLGAKGGATFATVSNPDATFADIGRRTGSVIGAYLTLGGNPIGLRGEVLLVQKGFSGRQDGANAQFNIDYVELPLLVVLQFGVGPVQPAVYGGAAVGFERDCRITASGGSVRAEGDCDDPDLDLERETMDVGAVFGAEIMFGLGGISVLADARYTAGLTTLDASDDPDAIKNRAFLLMAGVAIPIG